MRVSLLVSSSLKVACIMSHPGDVILTETYKQSSSLSSTMATTSSSGNNNKGIVQVVSQIYDKRGLKGFVTGLSARFVHVGAIITSQLVLYDTIKQLLGLPATGSH